MTDVCGERCRTVVSEVEAKNLEEYAEMPRKTMSDKRPVNGMKDDHELVADGRCEISTIE